MLLINHRKQLLCKLVIEMRLMTDSTDLLERKSLFDVHPHALSCTTSGFARQTFNSTEWVFIGGQDDFDESLHSVASHIALFLASNRMQDCG